MTAYGKIGYNRIVEIPAKAEKGSLGYLTSDSIRDCRMSRRAKSQIRVKATVGATGGYIAGADRTCEVIRVKNGPTPKRNKPKQSRSERISYMRANNGRLAR